MQSKSIIIKALYRGLKIILKLTPNSPPNDNAQDVERQIYIYMAKYMNEVPNHFLKGLAANKCSMEELMESKNPNFNKHSDFAKIWNRLRGNYIVEYDQELVIKKQIKLLEKEWNTLHHNANLSKEEDLIGFFEFVGNK